MVRFCGLTYFFKFPWTRLPLRFFLHESDQRLWLFVLNYYSYLGLFSKLTKEEVNFFLNSFLYPWITTETIQSPSDASSGGVVTLFIISKRKQTHHCGSRYKWRKIVTQHSRECLMAKRSWVNFAALWAWLKDGNKIINRKCAVHFFFIANTIHNKQTCTRLINYICPIYNCLIEKGTVSIQNKTCSFDLLIVK